MSRVLGPVPEHSSGLLVATLRDELGVVIEAARLASIKLTLRDLETQTVVNGWDGVEILGSDRLTITATEEEVAPGVFRNMTFVLTPDDNALVAASQERHRAFLRFSWDAGDREHCAVIDIDVFKAT